ncbi:MAG: hypothetical protein JSW48_14595 [Betaproteobacteria bacterium]|nr:MAG: hypothetical protein JSW48_14595 [Betaproteobacteria bacterium]
MSHTPFIGKRIELVSMDPHFHDISIGLYEQQHQGKPVYLVHTYSHKEGTEKRINFVVETMKTFGGLESADDGLLQFPCGEQHALAIKRVFLDSCKVAPQSNATAHPLRIHDKKSGCDVTAESLGNGEYRLQTEGDPGDGPRRIAAIARGLAKLGEMETYDDQIDKVTFACGQSHDALIGLLLIRAPNVRAVMREVEMMAARGVLAAPGAQQ